MKLWFDSGETSLEVRHFSVQEATRLIPLFDLMFMNGYALVAAGAALQVALQEG